MIEIIKKTNIDFMGMRKYTFVISGILILLGAIAVVQIINGTANLGIDFAGGTTVQIKFENPVKLQDVRSILIESNIEDFDLQDLPSVNNVLVTIKREEEKLGVFSKSIRDSLSRGLKDNSIVDYSVSEIGPKVGKRLRVDAMWAVIAATIGILIYVGWRFQFRFSVGATVATFHDVLAVLGIFNILGIEINLILLSALLTIAGYSLTDTVVVFDRIRENLGFILKDSVEKVINKSLNEVLSRTLITSITTLLAAGALFIFGGEVLHNFALAIILGVIIGTYSSMYVASPVVLMWGKNRPLVRKS